MSKYLLKFVAVTILLVGAFMFAGGSETSALTDNCSGAPGDDWGNNQGPHTGAMASAMISANVAGEPHNMINTKYTIRSQFQKNPSTNERIFDWPLGGGRTDKIEFETGENIYRGAAGPINCNGWSVIAAGTADMNGNRHVLDCGDGFDKAEYWIDSIPNPPGENGRWEMWIDGKRILDVNKTNKDDKLFSLSNGERARISLYWVAEDWELEGASGVNKDKAETNEQVTFSHGVRNKAGSDPARYNWKVEQQNPGGSWFDVGPSGSPDSVGAGNSAPAAADYADVWKGKAKFTIPDSATKGQQYCQRIVYSNDDGPGTGSLDGSPPPGYSTKACVTVKDTPPDPPDCSFVEVWNKGDYTAPSGADRATRAVVTIDGVTVKKVNGVAVTEYNNVSGQYAPDKDGNLDWRSKTWNVKPIKPKITITVQKEYFGPTDGKWYAIEPATTRTIDCYSAKCGLSVTGTGLGGRVMAGEDVTVNGWIWNDAPTPDNLPLNNPFLWGTGNSFSNGLGTIPRYGAETIDPITIKAPSSAQDWEISYAIVQWGLIESIGSCKLPVKVYDDATLTYVPHAELDDEENPTKLNSYTIITNSAGRTVILPTKHTVYKVGASGSIRGPQPSLVVNDGGNIILPSLDSPVSSPLVAGDQFCTNIESYERPGWRIASGIVDAAGNISDPVWVVATPDCATVHNKPYFKAFGKGVVSGGGFESNGSCTGGGLLASWYNYQPGIKNNGSSSQLSALANIKITGFASAQTGPARSPTNLTFANSIAGSKTTGTPNPYLGGKYNAPHCLYEPAPPPTGTPGVQNLPNGSEIPGRSVSTNQSVFVNGDVYISDNITLTGAVSQSSFVLKASGNIYIAPGVKRLDGVYVSKGAIYTCSNASGNGPKLSTDSGAGNSYYSVCNNQLLIRGTFVARKVNLMRTYGSLRNSVNNEQLRGASNAPINSPCVNPGPGAPVPNSKSCAAEIFDFGPELYLANPAVQLPNGGSTTYDAITSLPPVL